MSIILSLETSSDVCSVALHQNEDLRAEFNLHISKAHSKSLASIVDEILTHSNEDKKAIDAVAISKGPGSYTGLRIGTSFAKGLCYGLDIPLISINTLVAMAHETNKFNEQKALLCPMIDARRMEVYSLVADSSLKIIQETQATIVDESSFSSLLDTHKIWFFGNGAGKCESIIGKHKNAVFLKKIVCTAKSIGEIAIEKYKNANFEDLADFEPFYVKDFIAGKPKTLI